MIFSIHLFQTKKLLYHIFWQLSKMGHSVEGISAQVFCKPKIYGRAWVRTKEEKTDELLVKE